METTIENIMEEIRNLNEEQNRWRLLQVKRAATTCSSDQFENGSYWRRHPITFQKSLPWFKSGK